MSIRPAALVGVAVVGMIGAFEYVKGIGRRQVSQQLAYEHTQLSDYHQIASYRAMDMGVIEPSTE